MGHVLFYMLRGRDFANAGRISTSIKRYLRDNNYPSQIIQRVAIVTYESEINLACYTHYGYIFIYLLEDSIRIVVKDRGQGIEDIDQAMQEGFSTASDEIRKLGFGAGMGLSNIKKELGQAHHTFGTRVRHVARHRRAAQYRGRRGNHGDIIKGHNGQDRLPAADGGIGPLERKLPADTRETCSAT